MLLGTRFIRLRNPTTTYFSLLTVVQLMCWVVGMMGGFIITFTMGVPLVCGNNAFRQRQDFEVTPWDKIRPSGISRCTQYLPRRG